MPTMRTLSAQTGAGAIQCLACATASMGTLGRRATKSLELSSFLSQCIIDTIDARLSELTAHCKLAFHLQMRRALTLYGIAYSRLCDLRSPGQGLLRPRLLDTSPGPRQIVDHSDRQSCGCSCPIYGNAVNQRGVVGRSPLFRGVHAQSCIARTRQKSYIPTQITHICMNAYFYSLSVRQAAQIVTTIH